ncbi:hypothetical protein MSAN_01320800 [Mycena sanguinolenta]|uniref:Ricin B lectin domain-containing protein n=1 Tax=Mycena sanguinolenta TaxID=230812 RepID=A0A8H6YEJ7_9AGAR|nr:hypothetical protein MSAN_01320800 [Mycena sanguinolenta]
MLPKFLAYGLAALALVGATPFQANMAACSDNAVTTAAAVEAGNYYLLNVGTNEMLFSQGRAQPLYTKSTLGTPEPLAQWKVEPGAKPDEYKIFNIGSNLTTAGNNGRVYLSYPNGPSLTYVVTPAKGNADMFTITAVGYRAGTLKVANWDTYYNQNQVWFTENTGSADQLWKFIRIN